MPRDAWDVMLQLLASARYAEVADLTRALHHDLTAGGEVARAEMLATARELALTCQAHHDQVEAHCVAAGSEAAAEVRTRMRLAALLDRAAVGSRTATMHRPVRPAEPGMSVSCLGPLSVRHGDEPCGPVPNRRARSVFKYLLVHRRRPIPKEVLMDLFWPDATAAAARNNLNVAVYGLRRYLHDADGRKGHVVFRDDAYSLNPDLDLTVDIDEFTARVTAAERCRQVGDEAGEVTELRAAAAVYRGPLFEDDPYEEWTATPRRALQDSYLGVLGTLGERHLAQGDAAAFDDVARMILAVEPAHERTHLDLMRSHARRGQHHLALRQYRDYAEAMAELDLAPGPEVVRLHHRIRRHEPV